MSWSAKLADSILSKVGGLFLKKKCALSNKHFWQIHLVCSCFLFLQGIISLGVFLILFLMLLALWTKTPVNSNVSCSVFMNNVGYFSQSSLKKFNPIIFSLLYKDLPVLRGFTFDGLGVHDITEVSNRTFNFNKLYSIQQQW